MRQEALSDQLGGRKKLSRQRARSVGPDRSVQMNGGESLARSELLAAMLGRTHGKLVACACGFSLGSDIRQYASGSK